MSFLLDPPLLFGAGALVERAVPADRRNAAAAVTVGAFVGVSVALYLDVPGLGAIWKPFGASGGRDFMVRSGLPVGLPVDGAKGHATAALLFATYPLWFAAGRHLARRRRPAA